VSAVLDTLRYRCQLDWLSFRRTKLDQILLVYGFSRPYAYGPFGRLLYIIRQLFLGELT